MMNRRCRRSASVTVLLSLIFLLQGSSLNGQDTISAPLAGSGIGDLQMTVLHDRRNAEIWWYGWLAGYSAATAGQAAVAVSTDKMTTRQDMVLGAATTFLGAMGQLIAPIGPRRALSGYPTIREYTSGGYPLSDEESAALLKVLAAREKEGRSWKTHAIAGAVNLGSGLITWLGFKRTVWDGVVNFALNTAVTEAQIWTQPTRAIKDYEKYLREYQPGERMAPVRPESELTVSVFPGGIAIRVDF